MRWQHSKKYVGLVGVIIALTLSGCGAATTSPNSAAIAASTATASAPSATATAAGPTTTLPTVGSGSAPTTCATSSAGLGPQSQPLVRVGDLLVSQLSAGLSYPAVQIPEGTPAKPLKLAGPMSAPNNGAAPIDPALTGVGGYAFSICNASTSNTDTIQSIAVRVASFAPFSGPLSAWNPCKGGSYDAQAQATMGGCGGGLTVNETLQANFPSNAGSGATVTATQARTDDTGPNQPNPFPALPMSLAPGQGISVVTGLTAPTAPGTYTFSLGLAVNSTPPVFFSTSSPVLFAPVTQEWTGQNCTTAAMKTQIPAATQPTYYICPPTA